MPSVAREALVIIIEPQGRDDPTKEFSWPVYLTVARRHLQCHRALLLVICPDPEEAKKCRRLISIGHVRESTGSVAGRKRLSTIMLKLASDAARRRLEAMMTTMEWKSDFIEGFVQEGLQQGAVKAKTEVVLKIIDARDRRDRRAARPGHLQRRHRPAR